MERVTFLHSADLHLDSPFIGLREVDGEIGKALRDATLAAFDNLVGLALDRRVDFLLVAGDVYDGEDRSLRAQLRFRDGLDRLAKAGIRTYVVCGNHDPLDSWVSSIEFPPEVTLFGGNEVTSAVHEREGQAVARIHGISYPTRTVPDSFGRNFQRTGSEPLQIGLFHCNAGGDLLHDPYAPRTVAELSDASLDYWALGHVHERRFLSRASPMIAYPGNLQGRHIREPGPRGCLFVEAQGGDILRADFVELDVVRWEQRDVSIEGLDTIDGLLRRLNEACEEMREGADHRHTVARLRLVGRGGLHSEARSNLEDLTRVLRESQADAAQFVWVERLEGACRPPLDLEERAGSEDLLGELLRIAEEIADEPGALEEVRDWLTPLFGHTRARRYLDPLTQEELLAVLAEARLQAVDLLMEGTE